MNNSHLFKEGSRRKEFTQQDKPLLKKKTSKTVKSRRFKRTKNNRGLESVRDQRLVEEKRERSQPAYQNDLSRQKTFDSKSGSKSK